MSFNKVIHAPHPFVPYVNDHSYAIFLAGSIEMGKAKEWQQKAIELLEKMASDSNIFEPNELVVLNPRRPDWDSTWEQSITNPYFNEQVRWEIQGMEAADSIIFFFAKDTISPISLFELGKYHDKALVVVEEGYLRKGNVDIYCDAFRIPKYNSLEELINLQLIITPENDEEN